VSGRGDALDGLKIRDAYGECAALLSIGDDLDLGDGRVDVGSEPHALSPNAGYDGG
jgi:hypothetical protein